MSDSSDIEKLLRLKKYETPGDEYFEQFAQDFKDRQRSEMLQHSSVSLLGERVSQFVSEMGPAKWALPTMAAAAAVAGGIFIFNSDNTPLSTEQPIATQMILSPDQTTLEGNPTINLDLSKPKEKIPGMPERSDGSMIPVGLHGPLRQF